MNLDDPTVGKACPKCRSERYYWLKSSGRCFECGFHWGMNKDNGRLTTGGRSPHVQRLMNEGAPAAHQQAVAE